MRCSREGQGALEQLLPFLLAAAPEEIFIIILLLLLQLER
jgi:hypothetical protein